MKKRITENTPNKQRVVYVFVYFSGNFQCRKEMCLCMGGLPTQKKKR